MSDRASLEVQYARLEERILALDRKTDLYHSQSAVSREALNSEVTKMNALIKETLKDHNDRITGTHDKLSELRRDRTWIVSIFGLLWGIMAAYVQWKIKAL